MYGQSFYEPFSVNLCYYSGADVARGFGLVFFLIISAVLVVVFLPLLALVGSFAAAISVALLLGSDILAAK